MRNLRRSARRHQAGVVSEDYYAFPVGAKVLTVEGFPGTVIEVEDGPFAGDEQYIVELDGGMGGGAYSSSELSPVDGDETVTAKTATSDEAADWDDSDREDMEGEDFLDPPYAEDADLVQTAAQVEATGLHMASEDYPELSEILVQRPPLAHSERVAALRERAAHREAHKHEAGFWDRALEPIADHMLKAQDESGHGSYNFETGEMASYDWCRFRHNSHCWFPKTLDAEGSKQAGYAVWTPEDRGFCPRSTFAQQKACPAPSEPGPHSGEPRWRPETWQSWEDGGQHVSHKTAVEVDRSVKQIALEQAGDPVADLLDAADPNSPAPQQQAPTSDPKNPYTTGNPYSASLDRREAVWHLTASWKDVQAKAKRIRAEGHVRIISSSPGYLVGQVEGDHGVYQAELTREPGTTRVATWSCGCPWAAYSWGRSGRWAKYEGRQCSHALALMYEGASRGWHGKEVKEDPHTPAWLRNRKVMVPGDYQPKPIGEWKKSSLVALAGYADIFKVALVSGGFQTFDDVADYMLAQISNVEPRVTADLTNVAREHDGQMEGLEFRKKTRDSLLRKLPQKAQSPQALSQPFSTIKDCLVPGTLIETESGPVPIEKVKIGTRVWTRDGLRRVTDAWLANPDAKVYEVLLADGTTLRGTHDHRVWVDGFGWKALGTLRYTDRVLVWRSQDGNGSKKSSSTVSSTTATRTPSDDSIGCTSGLDPESRVRSRRFIGRSTSSTKGRSLTAGMSTMLTMTPSTTTRTISSHSRQVTMQDITSMSVSPSHTPVSTAERDSTHTPIGITIASARTVASRHIDGPAVSTSSTLLASSAGMSSESPSIGSLEPVVVPVVSVSAVGSSEVYDLTVDGAPEFFANGILVHNCLRYTIAFPEPDWGNSVQKALWELQSKGYKINAEESTWQTGDPYSGLHYDMQAPGSDIVFELQFHTTSSYDLKNKVLHQMYEEFRDPSVPLKRRQDLYDQMSKYWDQIPIPANALDFPNQKVLPRPTSAMRPVGVDPELAQPPVYAMVRDMLSDGDTPSEVLATLVGLGLPDAPGLLTTAMATQPFKARVRGLVTDVLDLLDNHVVKVRGLGNVTDDEVLYPTYNPVRGLTASLHTASADSTGCMVAIEIPRAMAEAIHSDMVSLYGGDVEPVTNYHVTLAYPGDAEDIDTTAFAAAVNDWASRQAPLTGRLSGYGVFHQEGGDKVLYASVDLPGLESAREDLVDTLSRFGIDLPGNHGFTPHLTLGYFGEANTPTPPEEMPPEAQESFTVTEVALVEGTDWRHVPFGATRVDPLAAGADVTWGSLPDGAYDEVLWTGDGLPLEGSPEAAASYVAPVTAGRSVQAMAALPEGYSLQYTPPGNINNGSVAAIYDGKVVGAIQWKPAREVRGAEKIPDDSEYGYHMNPIFIKRPPQIVDLKVQPAHRRKGLATAMYEEAKRRVPDLVHDDIVLPDGQAWMKSLSAAKHTMQIEHNERGLHRYVCPTCASQDGNLGDGVGRWLKSESDVRDRAWAHALAEHDLDWDDEVAYHSAAKEAVYQSTAAKDETVSPSEHGDPRLQDAGVTVAKDDDGYYVRTHRARSDSYDSVEKIPQSDIDYIESTGAVQAEYYTADELRSFWTSPMGGTEGCDICGDSGHTTAEHEAAPQIYDDVNRVAELHAVPEPALPTTDGADEDEEQIDDVDDFVPGDPRLAHLMGVSTPQASGGDKDMNIAQAAKAHLAKTALKDFTPAEQKQIIDEGSIEGVVARNLSDLDLEGTHYAVLEEALQAAETGDDEETWLY